MPLLDFNKAITNYYNKVKDKYPTLSFESFKEICTTPFRFMKFHIKLGNLSTIMLTHLGKFRVTPSRLYRDIEAKQRQADKGYMAQEDVDKLRETRLKQINFLKNDDKKSNKKGLEESD